MPNKFALRSERTGSAPVWEALSESEREAIRSEVKAKNPGLGRWKSVIEPLCLTELERPRKPESEVPREKPRRAPRVPGAPARFVGIRAGSYDAAQVADGWDARGDRRALRWVAIAGRRGGGGSSPATRSSPNCSRRGEGADAATQAPGHPAGDPAGSGGRARPHARAAAARTVRGIPGRGQRGLNAEQLQ